MEHPAILQTHSTHTPASSMAEEKFSSLPAVPDERKGVTFWLIFFALALVSLLSALEVSIIGPALPTIVTDLAGEGVYVWFITAFLLTSTTFLPLFGQLADIFGRKYTLLLAILWFTLGCVLCGAAQNASMMIAGRAVQGIGGGGILALVEIVVSDITTLRERGKYVGYIGAVWCLGTVLGPIIGGALATAGQWRWIFYLNLPLCGIALVLVCVFLNVNQPAPDLWRQAAKIDYVSNVVFCGSVVAIQIALAWGGFRYGWQSVQVLVPLLVGFAGLAAFLYLQTRVSNPMVPLSLFGNRTSATGYALTFLHAIVMYGLIYMLPIYFEAVKEASPIRAGVMFFPSTFLVAPFAIFAGIVMAVTGTYKAMTVVAFALMSIGVGLMALLETDSPDGYWIGFQLLFAPGAGVLFTCTLPAIQAALRSDQVASATATFAFARSFGGIFGLAVPVAIFNSRITTLSRDLPDGLSEVFSNGNAYALAGSDLLKVLSRQVPGIKPMYTDALASAFYALAGVAVLGFFVAFGYRSLELRMVNETEYGIAKGGQDEEKRTAGTAGTT